MGGMQRACHVRKVVWAARQQIELNESFRMLSCMARYARSTRGSRSTRVSRHMGETALDGLARSTKISTGHDASI